MADIVWTERASDDLDRIVAHIEIFDPAAAVRIGTRLIAAGQSLQHFPRRGRPVADDLRELPSVPPT